jgi:hypothetical protein
MEPNVELRDEAELVESSEDCVICNENLNLATGYRRDRGVCVSCGFPYKMDADQGKIEEFTDSVVYSSYDVSAREIKCINEYWDKERKPAPLWSYSPFKYELFEEFSTWAKENGFEEFSWIDNY